MNRPGEIASGVLTGVIVIAVVFVLVRPGSKAAGFVKAVSGAMLALVSQTTGYAETKAQRQA